MLGATLFDGQHGDPPQIRAMLLNVDELKQVSGLARQFGGMGLGLAIVRNLVEAMDGHVSLESEPNCGCLFKVLIPLATTEPELATRTRTRVEAEPLTIA